MPNATVVAMHPVGILKQAVVFCRSNLKKLGIIYLIFNLPVTIISFLPFMNVAADQKFNFGRMFGFLVIMLISSWGYVAMLLITGKIINGQATTIKENIREVKDHFLKYLILIICIVLFVAAFAVIVSILGTVILPLLLQLNRWLGVIFGIILLLTTLFLVVGAAIRWSLSALACVFENLGPWAALKRSRALINKHVNPVVGTYGLIILAYVIGLLPVMILGGIVEPDPNMFSPLNIAVTVYILLINVVLVPFWTMSNVVLYKKLQEAV